MTKITHAIHQNPLEISGPIEKPTEQNTAKKAQDQKIQEAVKKSFNSYNCFSRIGDFIKSFFSRVASIPGWFASVIQKCFSSDEELEIVEGESEENEKAEFRINSDIKSQYNKIAELKKGDKPIKQEELQSIFAKFEEEAQGFINEINDLEFKSSNDLKKLKQLQRKAPVYLSEVSNLKGLIKGPSFDEDTKKFAEDKISFLKERFNLAKTNLQDVIKYNKDEIKILENKIRVLNGSKTTRKFQVLAFEEVFSDEQHAERIRKSPPKYFNAANNCWFHASLQFLWAMGDYFHELVKNKYSEADLIAQEYENEKKAYKAECDRYTEYTDKKALYEAYKSEEKKYLEEMKKYSADQKKIDNEFKKKLDEYQKKVKQYEEEMAEWEKSDKTTPEPTKPEEPVHQKLEEPAKPDPVPQPGLRAKPFRQEDPMIFLNALSDFSSAMKSGKPRQIQKAEKALLKALQKQCRELSAVGAQHDAPPCIEFILNFLAPKIYERIDENGKARPEFGLFNLCKRARPILEADHKYANYEAKKVEPTVELNVPFDLDNLNETNVQVLVDNFFSDQVNEEFWRIEDAENLTVDKFITSYEFIDKENPPDYFAIQLKRYDYRKPAQLERELERIKNECQKKIETRVKDLEKKKEYKDKKPEELQSIAETQLKSVLPRFNPDPAVRIDAPVHFPKNQEGHLILNMSKAFGAEIPNDPKYEYRVTASVRQSGRTIHGGHYVADVLGTHLKNGLETWYHCNDFGGEVSSKGVDKAPELVKNGYVFLLKRVHKSEA